MRRSPYQSLAAILITTITFLVGYGFSLFSFTTQTVLRHFETQPQVIAFFKLDTQQSDIDATKQKMAAQPYVKDITIVSKEEALQLYQKDNQSDPLLLELVTADILPASIEVSGIDISALPQIKRDLEKTEVVEEVVLQQDIVSSLEQWTKTIRWIGIGSMAILGTTAFLIIVIITGMKVASKRRSIQIMNILGATNWFIRGPFLYEGMLYGLLSSLIGWLVMYVAFLYISPWLSTFIANIPVLPIPWQFFAAQLAGGTLAGIILGSLASSVAVGRMLKK